MIIPGPKHSPVFVLFSCHVAMPDQALILTLTILATALAFDFVNGFHDASNSIATVVATRVLKAEASRAMGGIFQLRGVFLFGAGVAKTVGSGMVALDSVTPGVIVGGPCSPPWAGDF